MFDTHLQAHAHAVDVAAITGGLGHSWELINTAVKPYPICHFLHGAAEAAMRLHGSLQPTADSLAEVRVRIPGATLPIVAEPAEVKAAPANDYDAKFSAQFVVDRGWPMPRRVRSDQQRDQADAARHVLWIAGCGIGRDDDATRKSAHVGVLARLLAQLGKADASLEQAGGAARARGRCSGTRSSRSSSRRPSSASRTPRPRASAMRSSASRPFP